MGGLMLNNHNVRFVVPIAKLVRDLFCLSCIEEDNWVLKHKKGVCDENKN
jgi:hypothetical protein